MTPHRSRRVSFAALLCAAALATLAAQAPEFRHSVIKPMPGATPTGTPRHQQFSQMDVLVQEGTRSSTRTVQGEYWYLPFLFNDASGRRNAQISVAEILGNYETEAKRVGGLVRSKTANRLVFSLPRSNGALTWAKLYASAGAYQLEIVDEKALETTLVFDADAMRKALASTGHVAVYGILFDTDRASLKPGSGSVLDEIAKLLAMDSALRLEVQGHTDSSGAAAHNRDLSLRRAQAVAAALALYGIDAARLVPKGFGPDKPISDNATEDGRQKNRRVELVKLQ